MSFRSYSPNPTLQRLRLINESDGSRQIFQPVPIENYIPLSTESLQDAAYERHTISDYGDLTAAHCFAVTTHDTKRLRQRRRSSATGLPSTATRPKARSPPHNNLTLSTEQEATDAPSGQESESEDSSSSSLETAPTTPDDERESNSSVMITGRPVFVPEDNSTEDLESAVILKAKWEKFTRASPIIVSHTQKAS